MELVEFAYFKGIEATRLLGRKEQKSIGQFITPPDIARFMAQRCLSPDYTETVSILDPAAGSGVLAAALVELLLNKPALPKQIDVTFYEIDVRLIAALRKLSERMRRIARNRGVFLSVSIKNADFLLSTPATFRQPVADIIIANPPYFKLNGTDPRAIAHSYAVYGQPNIYGLFMAVCASMLRPDGHWCFITPRSWTNGSYFSAVRRHLFCWLQIDAMHVFESRKAHFRDDEILQEAMITWATAQAETNNEIVLSSSEGSRDLAQARLVRLPLKQVISQDDEQIIALPGETSSDLGVLKENLQSLGLKVSTGPVVAFRAKDRICETTAGNTVPLLWMQHIDHMTITWPINKKGEHIYSHGDTAWMLVPNKNLVIMRRFSPKEDDRRITAAPYMAGTLPGAVLGLENHTNYIYRPGGLLSDEETKGIAAFLNSRIVDRYIRTIAGNTQVNARDLRKLPMPPANLLVKIGRNLPSNPDLDDIDLIVHSVLDPERPSLSLSEAS